jgi:hypothetical protein
MAPLAVNVVLVPAQMGAGDETKTLGSALTVAVTPSLDVEMHPVVVFLASA